MVEVFKTNVESKEKSLYVLDILLEKFPGYQINFDLDDCDKILRIEGDYIISSQITEILIHKGFICQKLLD